MEAKEQLFRNAVKQASEDVGLERKPSVIFCDGYIPGEGPNVKACIEVHSRVIYVSKIHLQEMDFGDIRHTAIHEVSHLFEQSHDGRFHRICQDIRAATWRPEFASGLHMTIGNSRKEIDEKIEDEKPIIDKTHCNYHLCRIEAELVQCPYCGDYFCEEHIKPIPPSMPNFDYPNKYNEWRDSENTHACSEYYDYLLEQNKERHRKYQWSLDTMNEISKPDGYYRTTKNEIIENESFSNIKKDIEKKEDKQTFPDEDINEEIISETHTSNLKPKNEIIQEEKNIQDKKLKQNPLISNSPTYSCSECGIEIKPSEAKIEYINGDNIYFCKDCYVEPTKTPVLNIDKSLVLSDGHKQKTKSRKLLIVLIIIAIISIFLALNRIL